jgi:Leucine-rich repeat (LRR) protein
MENMIYHLEKSHKAQQEALAQLNRDFELDFEGNELKLSLRGRNLGDIGLQLLSKIQFTDLKDINVSNNSISNISALNDMVLPHLEFINMSENNITDVEPIAKLDSKNLKEIFLHRNRIKDFSPFLRSNFPALERLRIENNNFNKDLQEFKDLLEKYKGKIIYVAKTLDEFNNKYKVEIDKEMKIISLNDLRAQDTLLQELYYILEPDIKILEISLRNNDIKNVSLISRIPYKSIRIIDLSMNKISNLEFILEMKSKNLRELYLNDNLLNDISCLIKIYDPALHKDNEKEKFPNLKVISLKNNLFKPDNAQSKRVLRLLKGKGIETDIKDDNKN